MGFYEELDKLPSLHYGAKKVTEVDVNCRPGAIINSDLMSCSLTLAPIPAPTPSSTLGVCSGSDVCTAAANVCDISLSNACCSVNYFNDAGTCRVPVLTDIDANCLIGTMVDSATSCVPATTSSPITAPSPMPAPDPTPQPTPQPTPDPTPGPTPNPTSQPTLQPTLAPTPQPTPQPIPAPTKAPTPTPTLACPAPKMNVICDDIRIALEVEEGQPICVSCSGVCIVEFV
jgi:hypothetical protein